MLINHCFSLIIFSVFSRNETDTSQVDYIFGWCQWQFVWIQNMLHIVCSLQRHWTNDVHISYGSEIVLSAKHQPLDMRSEMSPLPQLERYVAPSSVSKVCSPLPQLARYVEPYKLTTWLRSANMYTHIWQLLVCCVSDLGKGDSEMLLSMTWRSLAKKNAGSSD